MELGSNIKVIKTKFVTYNRHSTKLWPLSFRIFLNKCKKSKLQKYTQNSRKINANHIAEVIQRCIKAHSKIIKLNKKTFNKKLT